jgi:hypothetical protein
LSYYRHPYVGEGADGARRSAQIDRGEAATLDTDDPRRATLLESAARWEQQAEAIERQRAWTPPAPRPQPSGGRITASMLGWALLGVFLGLLFPFLPGFLYTVFTGAHGGFSAALTLVLWVVCVPLGGVLGSLWGLHRARRRPRRPIDIQQRPNQVIRRRRPGE